MSSSESIGVANNSGLSTRETVASERNDTQVSVEETRRQAMAAKQRAARSEQVATTKQVQSSATNAQAQQAAQEGRMQQAQGATSTSLGTAEAAIGTTMVVKATQAKVQEAIEEAGDSMDGQKTRPSMSDYIDLEFQKGYEMVIGGMGKVSQGSIQIAYANTRIDEGTSLMARAAEQGIISKREASTANKEMIRSQVLESKAQMQEQAMSSAREANAGLPEGQRLSDEELQEMGENIDQIYDKAFQAGAETLKNGGITSLETSEGDRHFIVDPERDGALSEVKIKTDDQGEAILDEHGRLQISEKLEPGSAENLSSEEKMQLIANISVANDMQVMINGDPEQGIPPLARIEIDHESGTIRKGQFDLNDPEQMQEFAMIVETADKEPPPLKFTEDENGELFFQEWDWKNNSAVGEKVSLNDIAGGEEGDKDLAAESLAKLGLNEGGSRADALSEVVDFAEASDNNGLPDFAEFQGFIFSGRPDASSSRDQGFYATNPGLAANRDEAAVKGNALSEA